MTVYSQRDIRAADLLAIILFAFGAFVVALMTLHETGALQHLSRAVRPLHPQLAALLWSGGAALLLLGLALNGKVRQLIRTGGREPAEYPGVLEQPE